MSIRNDDLGGSDWQDTGSTTLNGAIDDSVTTITVVSTASFKSAGYIYIDSELISYTGTTGTTFTGCTRGVGVTAAASHTDTTAVAEKEVFTSTDVNDTFDALFVKVQTLSTFWLNSDLYSVYDNFNSYTTGAITSNTNWTFTGTAEISATTNAGGDTKELLLTATAPATSTVTATASTKLLNDNRHTFARIYISTNGISNNTISGFAAVRFANTGSYYNILNWGTTGVQAQTVVSNIMVHCTGSGNYDLYIGGKKMASYSGVSAANAQILDIRASATTSGVASTDATTHVYVDDVRQTAQDVY